MKSQQIIIELVTRPAITQQDNITETGGTVVEVVDSHDASAGREESHHLDVVSVAAQDVVVEEYYPHREGESVNYQLLPTDTAVVVAYADPGLVSNLFLVCALFSIKNHCN